MNSDNNINNEIQNNNQNMNVQDNNFNMQDNNGVPNNQNNNQMNIQPNNNNNNKNNKGLIIGLSIAGVVIVLVIVGIFAWSKYVDYMHQKADDEIKDSIDDIDDLEDITNDNSQEENSDNNYTNTSKEFSMLGEIQNAKITYRNYDTSLEQLGCVGNSKFKFSIDNGVLTITETSNNKNYTLSSITDVKSIVGVDYSYSCEQEIYYILTNDGKIYYAKGTLNMIDDMSNINNYFVLLESNYNFSYTDIGIVGYTIDDEGINGSLGLIAKTATDDEIIFTNPNYEHYGFYRVI